MNNKDIVKEMRKYRISPGSERKMEFFRRLGEMGLLNRRYAVVSHKDFLAVRFTAAVHYMDLQPVFRPLFICTDATSCGIDSV